MHGQKYSAGEYKEAFERRGKNEFLICVHTHLRLVDLINGLCRRCSGGKIRDAGRPNPHRIRQATTADVAAGVVDVVCGFRDPFSPSSAQQTHQFHNGKAKENGRSLTAAILMGFLEDSQHLCRKQLGVISWVEPE